MVNWNHFLLGRKTLHEIGITNSERIIFKFPASEFTGLPVKMQILGF